MATFKVNGVTLQETEGAAIVKVSSNSFTLSWSGLSMRPDDGPEYFHYNMNDAVLTDEDEHFYTSTRWGDEFVSEVESLGGTASYILVTSSSGSKTITSDSSLIGKSLSLTYSDRYTSTFQILYITFKAATTNCREPTSPKLSATLSRDAVKLSWGAGSAGTNNSVTGYDVQRRESTDGNNWGSWENVPDSPVTTTEMNVSPPNTAGNYYQYQVRTRGSAGSNYYSGWVTGTTGETTLRRDHDTLAGFTDDPLTAGTSLVKALHMQELQSRVSTLRTFYGLGTYNFATITAGTTSLAGWTTHVNQIRTAIEDVCNASGKTHESWISFSVNCPRADVIQQLRRVILAL